MSRTNKELYQELSILVDNAYKALEKATEFANENQLTFHFSPAYGMGGTFYPDSDVIKSEYSEDTHRNYNSSDSENGWVSSSHNC